MSLPFPSTPADSIICEFSSIYGSKSLAGPFMYALRANDAIYIPFLSLGPGQSFWLFCWLNALLTYPMIYV